MFIMVLNPEIGVGEMTVDKFYVGFSTRRDPERIDGLIERLRALWKANPDLRLGQLIMNCSDDPYYYI